MRNKTRIDMKYTVIVILFLSIGLGSTCFGQSNEPGVVGIAIASENNTNEDTTVYEVKIDFNTLNSLSGVQLDFSSTEKTKDVESLKGQVHRKDGKAFLVIQGKSYPFQRYSVTVPVSVHKKKAAKCKFLTASAENVEGKQSSPRVFPKKN
jgi:hypothetical protein